ncbi:unnamed protein product [Prorocentrum cordatum]|uniref:Derlin n=1 Tax=Prorocentrum cordatum TaxID=2364126 RepID=A0ABN9UQM3_9DINO|nr:unnamed protein product [Polarella glacialis]
MAAAASLTMLVASTLFILLGLVVPLSGQSCAWTNPGVFPELLRTLLNAQAETLADICVERPAAAATGFLPSSPAVIAGCCGILAAALNILPFGSCTDGSSIARCAPAGRVRDTFLPLYALVLLILSIFGNESAESDALFPAVLAWAVFAFGDCGRTWWETQCFGRPHH